MTIELNRTRTAPEKCPQRAQNDQQLSRARSTPEDETSNRLYPPQFVSLTNNTASGLRQFQQ